MSIEQEKNALCAVRKETDNLAGLAKSFFTAVTADPKIKSRRPDSPTLTATLDALHGKLKPAGT